MENEVNDHRKDRDFFATYGGNPAENYERFFVPAIGAPLARDLVRVAALREGERVLDVACGTGVVARMAKERVGTGSVAGLDPTPGMLAVARSIPENASIALHEAKAEAIPLSDAVFDVVLCQLGLQFFGDKRAGLEQMRRVLMPAGRVVLSVVGPMPRIFAIMADGLGRFAGPQPRAFIETVFSLSDGAALERWMREAGFKEGSTRSETKRLPLPAPAEFLWQYVRSTPLAPSIAGLDAEMRSTIEREIVAAWQPFVERGALVCELPVLTTTARA